MIALDKLDLKDALDLAVAIEEEAMGRYQEFAEQLDLHRTPEAAAFFRFMARNEAHHRAALAGQRAALFGTAPVAVTTAMVFDVEAPEYDEARAFMSVRDALDTSLRAEKKAHAFFMDALTVVSHPEVRKLFTELAAEEVVHQGLVQNEIDRLPPAAEADPDDYVDEPVGQ